MLMNSEAQPVFAQKAPAAPWASTRPLQHSPVPN